MNDRSLDAPLPDAAFGETALLRAVYRNDRARVIELLDAGANVNQGSHWWAGSFYPVDHDGPLLPLLLERGARLTAYAASKHGMLNELKEIVAGDPAAVHMRGGDGQTPLHVARTVEVATLLLDHGADVNARDVDHESTPAQYLIDTRHDVVRLLIARGAQTDILMAAALGDVALVRRHLVSDPAAVRTAVTPAHFPMSNPRAGGTIYNWTLGRHASVHQVARRFGHPGVLALLLEHSPPDVRLADAIAQGEDAAPAARIAIGEDLHRRIADAACGNETATVRRMLKAGWPVDARGQAGATALHWAGFHGNAELVRDLLAAGAPLEARAADFGGTPLSWTMYGSRNPEQCATGDYDGALSALRAAGATDPPLDP